MSDAQEEEFVMEDEEMEGLSAQASSAMKKLRERLAAAVQEKQEYLEGWQRARADFANYKREEAGLQSDKEERVKAEIIESIIPALDTFEIALKHEKNANLELVYKQLLDSLRRIGVEKFGAVGEAFDPHKHEALAERGNEHKVESVERSGYSIGNKIIRPAQVII
jgi:molecular chaperone GrpE